MEMTKLTLSALVEVVDMTKRKTGHLTDSLLGVVRLPDGFDYRAAKDEYFGSRYGIKT